MSFLSGPPSAGTLKIFVAVFILVTDCFGKFEQKRRPALVFLANNDPLTVMPFFQNLAFKFYCFYVFSNFAHGNVFLSTFEAMWLILTLRHMFYEEIWSIS